MVIMMLRGGIGGGHCGRCVLKFDAVRLGDAAENKGGMVSDIDVKVDKAINPGS
jgi:hypothetical protein